MGAAWTDASGNFWLFGGVGADSTDTDGLLNDVWVYSPSADTWTWMGGSTTANATAVYGTEDVASASNTPGSRAQMLYWTDATHNLWLFGGLGRQGYQARRPDRLHLHRPLDHRNCRRSVESRSHSLARRHSLWFSSAGTAGARRRPSLSPTPAMPILPALLTRIQQ